MAKVDSTIVFANKQFRSCRGKQFADEKLHELRKFQAVKVFMSFIYNETSHLANVSFAWLITRRKIIIFAITKLKSFLLLTCSLVSSLVAIASKQFSTLSS